MTLPSTGTFSPGLTRKDVADLDLLDGMSCSRRRGARRAVFGAELDQLLDGFAGLPRLSPRSSVKQDEGANDGAGFKVQMVLACKHRQMLKKSAASVPKGK